MSRRCPNCKLTNPPEALRCDCGYDFVGDKLPAMAVKPRRKFPWSVTAAFIIAVLGNISGIREVRPQMLLIPVGASPSFSLTPGAAFAMAAITFLTPPFAAHATSVQKRHILGTLAICVALLSFPVFYYVIRHTADERHVTFGK